jgi:hypothetical protein
MRGRMGGMGDDNVKELRRLEYEGFLLVEFEHPSAISYGPRTFRRWEISYINADTSHTLIGNESTEDWARRIVDFLNGKFPRNPPNSERKRLNLPPINTS